MSTWTSQCIFYGAKVSYKDYRKIEDMLEEQGSFDYDAMNAENNEQGIGWLVDGMNGGFAMVGKVIMSGESNGNDTLVAAESGCLEIKTLSAAEARAVDNFIKEQLRPIEGNHTAKYYAVTLYS